MDLCRLAFQAGAAQEKILRTLQGDPAFLDPVQRQEGRAEIGRRDSCRLYIHCGVV